MSEARAAAWATRRFKYGPSGHAGSYTRTSYLERRALALVLRLHNEGTLSEGQCVAWLNIDRVTLRTLADGLNPPPQPDEPRQGSQSPDDGRAPGIATNPSETTNTEERRP